MRSISVIELKTHGETILPLLRLLEVVQCNVDLYIEEHLADQLPAQIPNVQLFKRKRTTARKAFVGKHLFRINQSDIVILNTLQKHIQDYLLDQISAIKILRLHNIHAYLAPFAHIKISLAPAHLIYDLAFLFKHTLLGYYWHKRKLLDNIDYVAFPSDRAEAYALQNYMVDARKNFGTIPLVVSQFPYKKNEGNLIRIVLPGSIDPERRDYRVVQGAFEKIRPRQGQFKKQVELTLLGNADSKFGRRVVRNLRSVLPPGIQFNYFFERVPDELYERTIKNADYILAPLKVKTRFRMISETYGLTKVPGLAGEIIRYSCPAIVPNELDLGEDLNAALMPFRDTSGLAAILLDLLTSDGHDFGEAFLRIQSNFDPRRLGVRLWNRIEQVVQ